MAKNPTDSGLTPLLVLLEYSLQDRSLSEGGIASLRELDPADWVNVLIEAKRQRVSGLLFTAVKKLPGSISVPDEVLLALMAEADRIQRKSRKIQLAETQVLTLLEKSGLHPVLMKGSRCARFYPDPDLRESGDIDLYLPPAEFSLSLQILKDVGFDLTDAPDGSIHYTVDRIDIDQHRSYFDLHRHSRALPPVPSDEAEILLLATHILKHASGTGVGLRQICDFALAFHHDPGLTEHLDDCFRKAGLQRWEAALLSFSHIYLGFPPGKTTVPVRSFMRIIQEGGDFGHHATGRFSALEQRDSSRKKDTLRRMLRHLPFALHYAPGEALKNLLDLMWGNLRLKI